ncbi:hypothetical protein LXL04_015938 [Taraxacum kok-saghyz]
MEKPYRRPPIVAPISISLTRVQVGGLREGEKKVGICGPHLQSSAVEEVDQTFAVYKQKTVCRKVLVISYPHRHRDSFHKIQVKLVTELEKEFSGYVIWFSGRKTNYFN